MSVPRIELSGIRKHFGAVKALRDVRLSIEPGEIHGLVGENGAGKSTLIKVISGVIAPDGGTLRLNGRDYRPGSPEAALHAGVGTVYQDPQIVPSMTVAENVFLGRFPTSGSGMLRRKEMIRRTTDLLKELDISLDPLGSCASLSVADQQLLQIARAASFNDLQLLILDEPTSTLTPSEVARLFGLVRRLVSGGVSVLFVSHKLEEVEANVDAVTIFRDGMYVDSYRHGEYTIDTLVRAMVGRELHPVAPKSSTIEGPEQVAIAVDRLSGARFSEVSFSVRAGEVFGLFGLVGAGRTEVIRAIFGADPILGGTISLKGHPFVPKSVGDAVSRGLAMVPEDRHHQGLVGSMSVAENINLATLRNHSRRGLLSRQSLARTAQEYVAQLGVKTDGPNAIITSLSGGNQQKVVIGRWLASKPTVLMLDEPAAGIDIGAKNDVYDLVDEIAASGVPVIVVSSELPEILRLCNRVGVMHEGRLVGIVPREQADEETLLGLATLGDKPA